MRLFNHLLVAMMAAKPGQGFWQDFGPVFQTTRNKYQAVATATPKSKERKLTADLRQAKRNVRNLNNAQAGCLGKDWLVVS